MHKIRTSVLTAAATLLAVCSIIGIAQPSHAWTWGGGNTWTFDVDLSQQQLGNPSKQLAHGDTITILPRVGYSDDSGTFVPLPWPTNATFCMFYQSGSAMAASNTWWTNSNVVAGTETGVVKAVWGAANDGISNACVYQCYIAAYVGTNVINQRTRFQMSMVLSPSFHAAILSNPVPWYPAISNIVASLLPAHLVTAVTNGLGGYWLNMN